MIFSFFTKKKSSLPTYPYNSTVEKPIIRASICNGEQVAGFKNKETGEFHEVELLRNSQDLEAFKKTYGLDHIDKEY